jgi:hypothetical protein
VAPTATDERDRELHRLAPDHADKARYMLGHDRPEVLHDDTGTLMVLYTVGDHLRAVRWLVVGTERGVLVVGPGDHRSAKLRETLHRMHPATAATALRLVVLGLAWTVGEVLGQDLPESPDAPRMTHGDRRKQLRATRSALAGLRERLAIEAHELEELPESGDKSQHTSVHAVRRARSAFAAGASAAERLYMQYGDELTEQSTMVNERLTLVSTVFLPATVTTGFFGMNFAWMTDRVGSMGAFVLLGVLVPLVVSAATLLVMTRFGAGRG